MPHPFVQILYCLATVIQFIDAVSTLNQLLVLIVPGHCLLDRPIDSGFMNRSWHFVCLLLKVFLSPKFLDTKIMPNVFHIYISVSIYMYASPFKVNLSRIRYHSHFYVLIYCKSSLLDLQDLLFDSQLVNRLVNSLIRSVNSLIDSWSTG